MTLTFEIDDEMVGSIEQYIATQVRVTNDEITKAQKMTRLYKDPAAFLEDALHQVVHQVVMQYPPDSLRPQLEAAAKMQADIKEKARPKRVVQ